MLWHSNWRNLATYFCRASCSNALSLILLYLQVFLIGLALCPQIRLYSLASALGGDGPAAPLSAHRMPAKLSSLAWCPDASGVVTVGDYDGEVSQIDLTTGHHVADADGHSGRRCEIADNTVALQADCSDASVELCLGHLLPAASTQWLPFSRGRVS